LFLMPNMTKKEDIKKGLYSTILLSKVLIHRLKSIKVSKNESYEEIISRMFKVFKDYQDNENSTKRAYELAENDVSLKKVSDYEPRQPPRLVPSDDIIKKNNELADSDLI